MSSFERLTVLPYARDVAVFILVPVLFAAGHLFLAWVAPPLSSGVRPGELRETTHPRPRRRSRRSWRMDVTGLFSAASTDPLPHSKPGTGRLSATASGPPSRRGGASFVRSVVGGSRTDGPSLRP